jgi:two-component system response regulator
VRRSRLILLVEDNRDDVELTLRAFEKSQVDGEIVVAPDGEEALEFIFAEGRHAGRDITRVPDVVLLDLKLPKLDGLEVLERLRADARTRRLPVVILTSSREQRDLAATYDLGANSYVQKPVDFDEFMTAARQIGVYWLDVNEVPPLDTPTEVP